MNRTILLAVVLAAAPSAWGQRQVGPPTTARSVPWPLLPAGVPIASFTATPSGGPASLFVQFADRSVGAVDTWTWDFGDGQTSKVQHPTHVYELPGTYTVTLTVSGPGGIDSRQRPDLIAVSPLPAGFVDDLVVDVPQQTTGFHVLGDGDFVVWVKGGKVWRWHDGSFFQLPLADISEEVGNWNDHGLHGFLFDPEYAANGYVYLYYVVDRHHLDTFGTPAYDPRADGYNVETIGRITRYTVFDPSDPATTIDPSTRVVLVGETAGTGIPICSTSHSIGRLSFGHDGSLLFSCGDSAFGTTLQDACVSSGLMRPEENIQQFRAQLLESASGKIHRIDRFTGDGLPDNPFYDSEHPRSWTSRVWTLGMRNPYRFAIVPDDEHGPEHDDGPGTLIVGDVGNAEWEELTLVEQGGENLGWPFYEGLVVAGNGWFFDRDEVNPDAPNPLFPGAGCDPYFLFEELIAQDSLTPPFFPNPCDPGRAIASVPTFSHERPLVAWGHRDQLFAETTLVRTYDGGGNATATGIDVPASPVTGLPFVGNASIGGTWYSGTTFPAPFRDVYFHGDYGEEWIRAFSIDARGELTAVHEFAANVGPITYLATDPESDYLYYLRYHGPSVIRRISYGANAAPIANVSSAPAYGPSPLLVELSAAASNDPEGASLAVAWDFGDGQPWTPLNELVDTAHIYGAVDEIELVGGTFVSTRGSEMPRGDAVDASPAAASMPADAAATSGVANDVPSLTDGVYPPRGSSAPSGQVVARGPAPMVGVVLREARQVVGLVFQEGLNAGPAGGVLHAPRIEYLHPVTAAWEPVQGLEATPAVPGDPRVAFETFLLRFDPVVTRAVRLRDGQAGKRRFTAAELRVLALPFPASTAPASYVATVTVTDDLGAESGAATLVSTDNTPPFVQIVSPAEGQAYPVGFESSVDLTVERSDAEHATEALACRWRVELVHDNHTHPEPPIDACAARFTLLPHGELQGDIVYWRFEVSVTDPAGLSTTVVRNLLPQGDCNLNGIEDSDDIAAGASFDLDLDGIPDECGERVFLPYEEVQRPGTGR